MNTVEQSNANDRPQDVLDAVDAQGSFHLGNFMIQNQITGDLMQGQVSVNTIIFWSRYASGSVTVTEAGQAPVTGNFGPNANFAFTPKSTSSNLSWVVDMASSFGYASVHCNNA